MSFTKPVVIDNQQVIALDFNDLANLPEELLRRVIQYLLVETSTYGWVISGLGVTDSSAGEVTSVQIAAGACILPSSAGDDGYRLLIVPANLNVPLTLPEAGTRTDVIQIVLQETPTENDARFVRSLGPGGEPQAAQENINTRLRVTGTSGVNEGGGTVASAGAVRLASVEMDDTEITEITDLRNYALPNGGTITTALGNYAEDSWDSISSFTNLVTNALALLTTRVNVNHTTAGKLKTSLDADEGPNLTLDADELDIGARDLVVDGGVTATGEGDFSGVRVGHDADVETFRASDDFLKINGASVCRLIGKAWMVLTWDGVDSFDFTSMTVGGHGISITREGPGNYTVTIDEDIATTVSAFDANATQSRFSVSATLDPYTKLIGGVDATADAEHWKLAICQSYRLRSDADNVFRVVIRVADGSVDPNAADPLDRSFTVRVFGPFMAPA